MADKTINYYEFPIREPEWAKLRQLFAYNISKYNVPFFEAGSGIEREFLRLCEASNIPTHRKTIVEYDAGDKSDRFLFLVVKDEEGRCVTEYPERFLDLSTACPGGAGFGTCGRGAKQVDTVSVTPHGVELVARMGILSTRHPSLPRLHLVSAPVVDALRAAGATGCDILPTNNPSCSQLCIDTQTAGPARIGAVRMGKRCPICATAKLFFGESERHFHIGDLKPVDFQKCVYYQADNLGKFEILHGFPIVSQRIFSMLLRLRVKGLAQYSTDPPIRHAVVQVRGSQQVMVASEVKSTLPNGRPSYHILLS